MNEFKQKKATLLASIAFFIKLYRKNYLILNNPAGLFAIALNRAVH